MEFSDYKKSFWDGNHSRIGDPENYVTNLGLQELCSRYKLDIPKNLDILDIGVGDGQLTKECSIDNRVYSVDISSIALEKVKNYAESVYLTNFISSIPPVDLAVAHLVFQHNPENEVHRIIKSVNLKVNGIFCFQLATLNPNKPQLSPIILNDLNEGMLHFYSKQKMMGIVSKTNKRIIDIIGPIEFDFPFNFDWYLFKVTNL